MKNVLLIAFVVGFVSVPPVRVITGTAVAATGNVVTMVGNAMHSKSTSSTRLSSF